MKALLWVMVGFVVTMWLLRGKTSTGAGNRSRTRAANQASGNPEPMVQCAHCGVHLPASEALTASAGLVFCSEEHLARHAAR